MSDFLGAAGAPYNECAAVVTSDTVDLAQPARALYIGVAGDVTVNLQKTGTNVLFKAVPVGILYVCATRVYTTGTAATNIVALW